VAAARTPYAFRLSNVMCPETTKCYGLNFDRRRVRFSH
jgi:hypothetical protein